MAMKGWKKAHEKFGQQSRRRRYGSGVSVEYETDGQIVMHLHTIYHRLPWDKHTSVLQRFAYAAGDCRRFSPFLARKYDANRSADVQRKLAMRAHTSKLDYLQVLKLSELPRHVLVRICQVDGDRREISTRQRA